MFRPFLNFRTLLALIAVAIVTGTIFYSNYLSKKIAEEEREKISQWIAANNFIAAAPPQADITLASQIQQNNNDIPVIWTNEKDSIIDFKNLDSLKARSKEYVRKKLADFKKKNAPLVVVLNRAPYVADKYYYDDSKLLKQIRYFPSVQLLIVALFILVVIYSITVRNKATQNQVWAGMARETAHQLGTPLTSLQGWVEILNEGQESKEIAQQMQKDVTRLRLISDRFGKIGSAPHLEPNNIVALVSNMIAYIKRIAPEKVRFDLQTDNPDITAKVSAPLFDWVIENLLKNALDAMDGRGEIKIVISESGSQVTLDIKDDGKGMTKNTISKIFKPGFTTKKRGWGLGLSLCKRIVEQYHQGQLFVKNSEPGKGTTFRIILDRI
ncbi:MAG TPA: HAMP domain-containing sensor histidine kinase [Ginsengibacter sp.]|mgnify:CR=1 FL=1|nr:HAMP domain-containing sensor histidine kinase [Ginsengibacter sp.]HRP45161.1 HAMP domain-containing sensor histidine kinase [Ginsengibacter sp.]